MILEGERHTGEELLAMIEACDKQCREDEQPSVNLWSEMLYYSWNMWEALIKRIANNSTECDYR